MDAALAVANRCGHVLPVVYNTSGYEREATLDWFGERVAVFLTDLRYAEAATAAEGSGRGDYVQVARAALIRMWAMRGPLAVDADGVATSGVICRILVLPGRSREAIANLRWIAEAIGTTISISLMSQYTPAYRAVERGGNWGRGVTKREYEVVCDEMVGLGFENGWIQEFEETPTDLIGFQMSPDGVD